MALISKEFDLFFIRRQIISAKAVLNAAHGLIHALQRARSNSPK